MSVVLRVENLVKHFAIGLRIRVRAVNGVSLELRQGETLGLVGESGSGKTTVGRCVTRLLEPTSGALLFRGQDITRMSARGFRRLRPQIQMVFQDPFDSLDPRMMVRDIIREPLAAHAVLGEKEQWERVHELAPQVGLRKDMLYHYPGELSSGQQQRVGVARALSTDPALLILDEPVSSLDPTARFEIIRLLMDLQERLSLTYIFISHDLMTVRYLSNRVAIMYLGKIVEMGPTEAIFRNPTHPYTKGLLSSFLPPQPGAKRSRYALSGEIPSPINLPKGCYLASRCPEAMPECTQAYPSQTVLDEDRVVSCYRVADGSGVSSPCGA